MNQRQPKKVIYLDQFAVSKIVIAIGPESERRTRLLDQEPFWIDLYRKLYRLLKLQLIVCPASCFHRTESLLSTDPDFESLRSAYSYLSTGCRFEDDLTILQWQVIQHFEAYLQGAPHQEPSLSVRDVIRGELEPWMEPDHISRPERSWTLEEVDSLRQQRLTLHEFLIGRHKIWQRDRCAFDVAVLEEAQALGRAIVQGFLDDITRHTLYPDASFLLAVNRPPLVGLVYRMTKLLGEYGIQDPGTQIKKVSDYFQSPDLLRVTFVRLSATLYAILATKAQLGQKALPDKGTITDVHIISSLLPYCDAMLLDAKMVAYLRENPLRGECEHFGTQAFSSKSKHILEIFCFLGQIEEEAGSAYVSKVERVYGKQWLEPNMNMEAFGWLRRRAN